MVKGNTVTPFDLVRHIINIAETEVQLKVPTESTLGALMGAEGFLELGKDYYGTEIIEPLLVDVRRARGILSVALEYV